MIYLDNASTTKIDPRVLDAMMPYLREEYGNPGNIHTIGRRAAEAVAHAREQVADFVGAKPDQIIFTSGGSESNNLAMSCLRRITRPKVITTAVEHDSLENTLMDIWDKRGLGISTVYPDESGVITAEAIQKILEPDEEIDMASVMYVNNETGAVNEVQDIGALCHSKNILFHTDCVQAAGTVELDADKLHCDFLSLSSHKIHGPKGVGALYARHPRTVYPLIHGGVDQEFGLRGGTENVAGIVGFGMACELAKKNLQGACAHTSTLKQFFWQRLREQLSEHGLSGIEHINGPAIIQPGRILNIRFDGLDAETLVMLMDSRGVCISAGSACRSHEQEPSYVLTSMGLSPEQAMQSVRVSFSDMNNVEETLHAAEIMAQCVSELYNLNFPS